VVTVTISNPHFVLLLGSHHHHHHIFFITKLTDATQYKHSFFTQFLASASYVSKFASVTIVLTAEDVVQYCSFFMLPLCASIVYDFIFWCL